MSWHRAGGPPWPDRSDTSAPVVSNEFAGTQADTLTSFVKSNSELVKVTAERDAARIEAADCKSLAVAVIERLTTERDGLHATLAKVAAIVADAHANTLMRKDGSIASYVLLDDLRAALEPTDQPKGKP